MRRYRRTNSRYRKWLRAYSRAYQKTDKCKERKNDWARINNKKPHVRAKAAAKAKAKRRHSPAHRIRCNVSRRIRHELSKFNAGKTCKTPQYLGCSMSVYIGYLESRFDAWMNWGNYGTRWVVDHIKPCAKFNLKLKKERRLCFHYKNTQPMERVQNIKKGDKFMDDIPFNPPPPDRVAELFADPLFGEPAPMPEVKVLDEDPQLREMERQLRHAFGADQRTPADPEFPRTEEVMQTLNLGNFTGSVRFTKWSVLFSRCLLTEGALHVADQLGCYWLMDVIGSVQPQLKNEDFQVWKLEVVHGNPPPKPWAGPGNTVLEECTRSWAAVICENGNGKEVYDQLIPYTDFPLREFTLWACRNELGGVTIMLPSEY